MWVPPGHDVGREEQKEPGAEAELSAQGEAARDLSPLGPYGAGS